MTSKLKCPVCKKPLEQVGTSRPYQCGTWGCDASFDMIGTEALWIALRQAKHDLKISRKALKDARILANAHCIATTVKTIDKAIEQIEHKDNK